MSLQTWWTGVQLRRVESKLKKQRGLQRQARERLDRLERNERKSLPQAEYEARRAKLEADRERCTHEISRLLEHEERLKAALRGRDATAPA